LIRTTPVLAGSGRTGHLLGVYCVPPCDKESAEAS